MKMHMLIELKERGYKAKSQGPIKVKYKNQVVGNYSADLLVEGMVILELQTVDLARENTFIAQILNYLQSNRTKNWVPSQL